MRRSALAPLAVKKPKKESSPNERSLLSHVEFVLENDFQELMVGKPAGFGFLEAQLERAKQPRETQGVRISFEGVVRHSWVDGAELMKSE